jgi:restriction system protein
VHHGEHPDTPECECYSGAIGSLVELSLIDISTPLDEIRKYLAARGLFPKIDPKLFEEVVCSVFSDLGWKARTTGYSDHGIDVILEKPSEKPVGVQVKAYKATRRIEAEQIRSLAGALVLNGYTKGIFVTTSSFRSGAIATAARYRTLGTPIELLNAEQFLEALGVAQRRSFTIDHARLTSYVFSRGVHLGSGPKKAFVLGENLFRRKPVVTIWTHDEIKDHITVS